MVIVVMGVSGSGKTVVGEALAARLSWAFEDADNWHLPHNIEKMHSGIPLTDEDRVPWIHSLRAAIAKWIGDTRNVVLACSALRRRQRDMLRSRVPPDLIRFAYLRGTYQEIDARLRKRIGHFMPESLLKSQFATLEEPDPSEALAVDIDQSVPAIVDAIVGGLHLQPG